MFESLSIGTGKIKMPDFFDALCFYRTVNFAGHGGRLVDLISRIGPIEVRRLIESGVLTLVIERGIPVVSSQGDPVRYHNLVTATFAAEADGTKIDSAEGEFISAYRRHFGVATGADWFVDRLVARPTYASAMRQAEADLLDQPYLNSAIKVALEQLVPGLRLAPINVLAIKSHEGFFVDVPVNFVDLNRRYHATVPKSDSSLSVAFLLAHILSTRHAIVQAIEGRSDVWLDDAHAACLKARVSHTLYRAQAGRGDIQAFNDVVFRKHSIGSAVESGARTTKELVDLLEHPNTRRFKAWLSNQEPDANLIEEYYRSAFGEARWQKSVLYKGSKIAALAGVGSVLESVLLAGVAAASSRIAGALADSAIGSADEFLLKGMLSGWRPTQWVDDQAIPFLSR